MSASSSSTLTLVGGSPGAATAEHRALRAELSRAAEKLCPPWLRPSRDDIVQEAFLRVTGARAADGPPPRSYLWKTVYTTMVDWIRREEVRQRGRAADVAVESVAGQGATPESRATARQIGAHIHDCVGGLSEPRRAVVAMYLQGHGAAEISRLLGGAYKSVENLLHRGLVQVRACLQRKGVTP
jgi:RNA polymerase sigma factor (sigma-70 family)